MEALKIGGSIATIGATSATAVAVPRRSDVIFGREPELLALAHAFDSVTAREGRSVLITGGAGLGKSALLRTFVRRVRGRATFVASECFALESSVPFAPFRRMFERLTPIAARDGGETKRIVAMLDSIHERDAAPVERSRFATEAARVLAQVARHDTLVISIEDIHWADSSSMELFAYLARSLADEPILFLATTRPAEGAVQRSILELRRSQDVAEVSVLPLPREDAAALVRHVLALDGPADHEFVSRLHARASGSPLLMAELLGALVERHVIFMQEGAWHRREPLWDELTPPSVESTVVERLSSMDETTARILRAAAVLGPRFSFEALAAITHAPEQPLIAAIRAGITSQLLEPEATGEHATYQFHHALLRDGVESSLLQPERAALHAAAAEILATHASAAELAHHYDVAGDRERAIPLHMRAALEAQRGFALGDAIRHGERVLDIAPRDPSIGAFLVQLLPSTMNLPDVMRAIRFVERVRDFCQEAGDRLHHGRSLAWLGVLRGTLIGSDLAEYIAAQRGAIAELEPLGDSIHLVNALANLSPFVENEEALSLAERALSIADRIGAAREQIRGHECCAWSLLRVGRPSEAMEHVETILTLTRTRRFELVGPAALVTFFSRAIATLAQVPRTNDRRRELAEEAVQWARDREIRPLALVDLELQRAMEQGDWDLGLRLVDEMASMERGTQVAAINTFRAAWIRVMRNGPEPERSQIEAVYADSLASAPWRIVGPQWASAIAITSGDAQRALALAEPFRTRLDRGASNVVGIYALAAARSCGDDAALGAWREPATDRVIDDAPAACARKQFAEAEEAVRLGDVSRALQLFAESAANLADYWEFAAQRFVLLRRVEVLASCGEIAEATAELEPLLTFWRTAKATWYIDQVAARLRPFGIDVPAPTSGAAAKRSRRPLTDRERAVALLVADGLTNKDIAAKLGVSVRTAESHVEQIRAKLGFRTRVQIATWVTERYGPQR